MCVQMCGVCVHMCLYNVSVYVHLLVVAWQPQF